MAGHIQSTLSFDVEYPIATENTGWFFSWSRPNLRNGVPLHGAAQAIGATPLAALLIAAWVACLLVRRLRWRWRVIGLLAIVVGLLTAAGWRTDRTHQWAIPTTSAFETGLTKGDLEAMIGSPEADAKLVEAVERSWLPAGPPMYRVSSGSVGAASGRDHMAAHFVYPTFHRGAVWSFGWPVRGVFVTRDTLWQGSIANPGSAAPFPQTRGGLGMRAQMILITPSTRAGQMQRWSGSIDPVVVAMPAGLILVFRTMTEKMSFLWAWWRAKGRVKRGRCIGCGYPVQR